MTDIGEEFEGIHIHHEGGLPKFKPPPDAVETIATAMVIELAEELDKTNERLKVLEEKVEHLWKTP